MYSYDVVTLDSVDYPVYGDTPAIDAYLNASMSEWAVKWRSLTDVDDKARYAVQMTRFLDRQNWKGTKTDAAQSLAWPRSSTGVEGVTDNVIPGEVLNAYYEGCGMLASEFDFETTQNQAQKAQTLKAGSASITYFRGAEGDPLRLPLPLHELLSDYLAGLSAASEISGVATGTDGESVTGDDFSLTRGL